MMFENIPDSAEVSLLESVHPKLVTLPIFRTNRYPGSGTANMNHQPTSSPSRKPQIVQSFKITNKMSVESSFILNLKEKCSSNDWIIVSIWGPEDSGKSFITDIVFSILNKKVSREMSRGRSQGANSYFIQSSIPDQKSILFLDWSGFPEIITDMDQSIFTLIYLLSSVIIFNRKSNDIESDNSFGYLCQKLPQSLLLDQIEIRVPKLILLSRDNDQPNTSSSPFLQRLHSLELFSPDISSLNVGKPLQDCQNLLDVPQSILNPSFIQPCRCLIQIINSGQPKQINEIPATTNIHILLPFIIQELNASSQIDLDSVWVFLVEFRRIQYYNQFVVIYQQNLEREFQEDSRHDPFTLFYKLKSVAKRTLMTFQQRYQREFEKATHYAPLKPVQEKIKGFIQGKQKMIREINDQKRQAATTKFQQRITSQYGIDQRKQNITDIIYKISNTNLKVNKSEILFNVVKQVMTNPNPEFILQTSSTKSRSFTHLKSRLQELDEEIMMETNKLQAAETQVSELGDMLPSQSLRDKQDYFKRMVEETYYMNKAFWELKRERENARELEMSKVKEYYDQIVDGQEREKGNLKEGSASKIEDRDLPERVERKEKELAKKRVEIEDMKQSLKKSKRRWLCCF